MPSNQVNSLVQGVTTLVSLPEVCLQVNDMVDDGHSSAADLAKVISQDPGLTTRLLKIANSTFYRFPSKIETVSRAITIIGTRELRFLVLAASAVRSFDRLPNDVIDMASFWRHSVYCGVIARILAGRCNVLHSERLFVAGLLHDIGNLVMYNRIPDLVGVMKYYSVMAGEPMYAAERMVFDCDHGEIGQTLMKAWNLPESLQEVAAFHHEPERAKNFALETALVHIANALSHLAELGSTNELDTDPINPVAWEITRLSKDIIEQTLQEARAQFLEALLLFLPGVVMSRR